VYPVTQGFLDAMTAAERQVFAKVVVDYTNPFLDQSIEVAVSEQANVSYPGQTADAVEQVPHKWASLDGTWTLDGTFHLAPAAADLTLYQMGWWGLTLAGAAGALSAPYPTLTVSFLPRPIHELKVVGDTARGEYPVDFTVRLYDQADALLHEETVTGNGAVSWVVTLGSSVNGVARMVLEITRWSHEGRQVKVTEFFTSIQETYLAGDLLGIRLLEEREVSQGSLPVGNISANEVEIGLANEGRKFDANNEQSPLYQLLKPNRRVQVWLGAVAPNHASDRMPTFSRASSAYTSDGAEVASGVPRFETGKFGRAVRIEESMNNEQPDPDFDQGMTGKGSYNWGGAGTVTASDGICTMDNASEPTQQLALITYPQITAGTGSYTFTIRCRSTVGADVVVFNYLGASYYTVGTAPASGEWVELSYTYANGTYTTNPPQHTKIDPGKSLEIDWIQLENKGYRTSWHPTTRAAEALSVPTAGALDFSEGTIACWFKPSQAFICGSDGWNRVIGHSTAMNRNEIEIFKAGTGSSKINFAICNSTGQWAGGSYSAVQSVTSLVADTWYHIAAVWSVSEGRFAIYINGAKEDESILTVDKIPSVIGTLAVGYHPDGNRYANSLIDDLRISSRARTDMEIEAAYLADTPFAWDEYTTYLLRFDGDLCPVEETYVPFGTFWSMDWDAPDDALEARLTARDRLELLRKGTYQSSQVAQNVTLYNLAETVLQDGGLEAGEYWLDPALQDTVVPYAWFTPISHREALRRIAEAALAAVYSDRDGVIRLEVGGTGLGATPALEITAADYFPPLHTPSRQDQVANEVIVDTQPLQPAAVAEEVYRSNEPITVPAGGSVQVTAYYNQPPAIEAAAALDSPPPGVSITGATYYGWGAEVTIDNTGGSAAEVTLYITGKPLRVANKERAVARDQGSIEEHGVLRYEFAANPLVQTLEVAQAIADGLLASVKDARRDVEVEWRGNPAVLLGDRATVKDRDYYVIRQEIDWAGGLSARLTGRKAT